MDAMSAPTIYKWKDASGGLHFTDTPPPADAVLIDGPTSRAQAAEADSALPASLCRSDITPAECEQARLSLQQDMESIRKDQDALPAVDPITQEQMEARRIALIEQECNLQRQALAILKERERGQTGEILSESEIAELPATIAETEQFLARNCGS